MDETKCGHRERLRNRYIHAGENGLPDYDMLELLLTYAIQRRDVKPMARRLLERFHDLSGIMDASLEDLCRIEGFGPNSAVLITLVRTLCTRYLENKLIGMDVIDCGETLEKYARMRLSAFTDEAFLLIFLDVKNHVIDSEVFARGTYDTIILQPRRIAEDAVAHKAPKLIVVHNHPSGITDPSASDIDFTRKLEAVLSPLDISLLDHLVVSRVGVYSFLNHGLLKVKYGNRPR
ncbi:MAG: DNA repair protein RadC [Lentisphaerae bacterium]|nr:DNA repair protein RadC [Lentisphaerota bacterium]